jgi:hypothetical protein
VLVLVQLEDVFERYLRLFLIRRCMNDRKRERPDGLNQILGLACLSGCRAAVRVDTCIGEEETCCIDHIWNVNFELAMRRPSDINQRTGNIRGACREENTPLLAPTREVFPEKSYTAPIHIIDNEKPSNGVVTVRTLQSVPSRRQFCILFRPVAFGVFDGIQDFRHPLVEFFGSGTGHP